MSSSKSKGKSMLVLSDLSNSNVDSGLDDQRTILSTCDSSNSAITTLDDVSEVSQPPVLNIQRFKIPRSSQWESSEMSTSSNTCNAVSSSSTNDEDESNPPQTGQTNEPSEKLLDVRKYFEHCLRNPKESSALDKMTLGDFRSELGFCLEESKLVSERRLTRTLPFLLSENAVDEATFVSKYNEEFSLFKPYPSKYKSYELRIISQPEEQHRARYMTEGSRGAVKDRSGSGYPTLRLHGYTGDEPILLQAYIGSDELAPYPHLYYQASKVCNKNSPPCNQKTIQGTTVIEMEIPAQKDMTFSIDCVGILKERNVDVDQRLSTFQEYNVDTSKYPNESTSKARKKSPSCRLVFRVVFYVTPQAESDAARTSVVLQVVSDLINCTQQTAGPEICRQSLTDCPCNGGAELFLIGKNFQKDSVVVFQNHGAPQIKPSKIDSLEDNSKEGSSPEDTLALEKDGKNGIMKWIEIVTPEKDFLHTNHLICKIPPYKNAQNLQIPARVQFYVSSGERNSACHFLTFHPINSNVAFMFSGSNVESKLLDTTIKNHGSSPPVVAVHNPILDGTASYNTEDVKVIAGTKIIRANSNEATQSSVIVFLPSGNMQNGQSQIIPVNVSSSSAAALLTQQEQPVMKNQMTNSSSSPIENARSAENPGGMQTVQLMLQPQNSNNVSVSQTKLEESFGLKDFLPPPQSQASDIILANLAHESTQESLFHDKKLKMENELSILTHTHNHEPASSEPQAKYLKGMNRYVETIPNPELSTTLTQQILTQQHLNLQQDQINNMQNELDKKVIEVQNFQQQQLSQVLQSQAQMVQDCRNQEIGRQLAQGLENNLQFQQQQHQIQQVLQIQMDQSLRTIHPEDQMQEKLRLDFERKLSPSEKLQLENGLHQIQQEQFENEKLRIDLQRLQQDPTLNGLQQQMTIEPSHIENKRHLPQDPSENSHLHFQLKESQLLPGSVKSSNVMTEVNKSMWSSPNSLFTNSISPSTKIENYFFGKENSNQIDSGGGTPFINSNPPINAQVMNFQSRMDTSFSAANSCLNKPNIFSPNQNFPLHPVESPSNLETKLQSPIPTFLPIASLPPNTNSLGFHPNIIRNSEIENMDVSVPNSLLKREENQILETANQMLNASVFGQTQQMQGITTSVVPMTVSLENTLPPTLPILSVAETQFLRPDNIFPTNMLTNSATGIAQPKPEHANLPILGNNIFPTNILEPNQQALINKRNESPMNDQREFLLQQAPTPMVLGHSSNSNVMKDNKATLMDVSMASMTSMAPMDKMDTSFSLLQTVSGGSLSTISQAQCKMTTSRDQMIKILSDTDMMYHLSK